MVLRITSHITIRRHHPEDHDLNLRRDKNLKSRTFNGSRSVHFKNSPASTGAEILQCILTQNDLCTDDFL